MSKKRNVGSDLSGSGRIITDAIHGIVDIVEAVHHSILSFGGLFGRNKEQRTGGISGMVYRNIRSTSSLVGQGLDVLIEKLNLNDGNQESTPKREAILAALNGVIGDYLIEKQNPLAIHMQLRWQGKSMQAEDPLFSKEVKLSKGKVVLLVHGSCMNDLQWNRKGHDHGAELASEMGYLPVYLHYNTGLHISENGRMLADLLETSLNFPGPIALNIIGHSMGGLVARSACHYGMTANHRWRTHLQKLIFLGTPHHGAPLEKIGNWVDNILKMTPYSAPFFRLGKIRSAGITDLRYGNLIDEDWHGRDRFKQSGDIRIPVPLPKDVACYAIAATTAKRPGKLGDELIGDGLVPLNSALGVHKNPKLNLIFPNTHQWIGRNMKHLDLFNHQDVYETIKRWCT